MPTENQQKYSSKTEDTAATDAATQSRRRFIRTGATGAVLTLASGSGMATVCTVPSGTMSGAVQSGAPTTNSCSGGMSPGFWKKEGRPWPTGASRDTPFGDVFASDEPYKSTTLGIMVTQQDPRNYFDTHNLGCHFTATYLNILAGHVTFLTVDMLKQMWNELRVFNQYVPTPNAEPWDAARVAGYLDSTYHD